jgi:transposase
VSGLGLPVTLVLTAGQASDVRQAEGLIDGIPAEVVIGDKGYDSDAVVRAIEAKGAEAVTPPKKNRKVQRGYDKDRYSDRLGSSDHDPTTRARSAGITVPGLRLVG